MTVNKNMLNTLKKEFSVKKLSLKLNQSDSIYESWVSSDKISSQDCYIVLRILICGFAWVIK